MREVKLRTGRVGGLGRVVREVKLRTGRVGGLGRVVREVSGAALHCASSRLHVDPQEVAHERLLEVTVHIRVIDDPLRRSTRVSRGD